MGTAFAVYGNEVTQSSQSVKKGMTFKNWLKEVVEPKMVAKNGCSDVNANMSFLGCHL